MISLVLAVAFAIANHLSTSSINRKLDTIYTVVQRRTLASGDSLLIYHGEQAEYVQRYLKPRLAENLKIAQASRDGGSPIVELTWETHWEDVTGQYRAAVQIRPVSDPQIALPENEGWTQATLRHDNKAEAGGVFNLIDRQSVILDGFEVDQVYDVRLVDGNYDSDDPPSLPLRFSVSSRETGQP